MFELFPSSARHTLVRPPLHRGVIRIGRTIYLHPHNTHSFSNSRSAPKSAAPIPDKAFPLFEGKGFPIFGSSAAGRALSSLVAQFAAQYVRGAKENCRRSTRLCSMNSWGTVIGDKASGASLSKLTGGICNKQCDSEISWTLQDRQCV